MPIHLLLIDDDPSFSALLKRQMESIRSSPFKCVAQAQDLDQAEMLIARHHIDLVLLDLELSPSHGLETFSRFAALAPDIPIVILSALEDEQIAIEAVACGAGDYLVKGAYTPDSLSRSILLALERHRHRQSLLREKDLAVRKEKAEAIARLASGTAHDFNNLISVIIGQCEMLQSGLGPDHRHIGRVQAMLDASQQAARLTQQLLVTSRGQTMEREHLDLVPLLHDTRDLLVQLIPEHIQLELHDSPTAVPAHVDRLQMEQAVINLVLNAVDEMGAEGRVELSCTIEDERGILRVSDTGPGIPADLEKKIFEPFFTTKDAGTGLGLSTTLGIIEHLGGTLDLEASTPAGSTFRISLPLATAAEGPIASSPAHESQPPALSANAEEREDRKSGEDRRSRSVLLVDDQDRLRHLLHTILEQGGYRVASYDSGESAMEQLEASDDIYDLLITDIVMKDIDGLQLYHQLRDRYQDLAVIFMSGHDADALASYGDEIRERPFLHKPVTRGALLRMTAQALQP